MIDSTFIDAVADIARQAAGTALNPIHPPQEPDSIYYVGGKKVQADIHPRNHKAASLSTIVSFANDSITSAVWYHRSGVVCLTDDAERRDRVTLPLAYSPQLKTILSWGDKSPAIPQAALILMLRTMFKNCLRQAPELIDILRGVRFKTLSDTESKVAHGKVSLGKKIETEVSGTTAIPEVFTLEVPIWDAASMARVFAVEIALDMNAASETFVLLPIPGSAEQAIANGETWMMSVLADELGSDYERLYYGTP